MDHRVGYLLNRLLEEGLIGAKTNLGARQTLQSWIKKGKLNLRRRPSNQYVVTEEEIQQIIKEFSPGGSGKWNYKNI